MIPIGWQNIIGKKNAVAELRDSFSKRRVNHAYLFTGATGVGKWTLALTLAARFLCLAPRDNDACGECLSCKLLLAQNHPDFLALPRHTRDLKIARFVPTDTNNKTDEKIEHLPVLQMVQLKPALNNGRVVIIPDAERMPAAAANAFLKTLEEPPPHSLFILTAVSERRIINTILSRCRRILLPPFTAAEIRTELARRGVEIAQPDLVVELANGSLGEALKIATGEIADCWKQLENRWQDFSLSAMMDLAETMIASFAENKRSPEKSTDGDNDHTAESIDKDKRRTVESNNSKRAQMAQWLDLTALKIRRLLYQNEISGWAASEALSALWRGGERLNANVRPELVAFTICLSCFHALKK